MKVEVSCLFRTDYHPKEVVRAHIGDNVWIEKIADGEWLKDVLEKQPRLAPKQEMGWRPFTHRFFVTVPGVNDEKDRRVKDAQELICQAIVLSRIVRPIPIAMKDAWVWTFHPEGQDAYHKIYVCAGFYGEAYVTHTGEAHRIEENDASEMTQLWARFHQFFVNEPQHRRIVRALKYFDAAYHISNAEQRHLIFHAALESMICTRERRKNWAEVTKRLPRFSTTVSNTAAKDIYDLCCDIKHAAAPIYLSPNPNGEIDPDDAKRLTATKILENALRDIFKQAILNPNFAEKLCDVERLKKEDPV
ncbi:MAG TPA: hypothetical protein PLD20_01255 [Blastocatellia bacterium]|nr:hypothetical protein [Blastocatellia bacterium]HMX26743.1 hypothetical protein [Blastocatellia bacterium]HMY73258.1 hypothetical protein [Blastocatellia bacterium]HMZ16563.1 hypothetical protein [Blastocatellia bacterium]HNG31645.1 hypothetical protein [Blastocatellia bacterium]